MQSCTSLTTTLQLLPQYCCNCSEHHNRNCPVSGKITFAEVTASNCGSVCVPGACLRRQWAWLQRQQASSNFHLTASLLKQPFVSAANATIERSISQREHRERYGTFALRNARLDYHQNPMDSYVSVCHLSTKFSENDFE